ncbi:hypothetical protein [Pantanalinema sp. GBBB05]|uniref:hypothetical protein n=1 Tax=Pantanalinema sp. GBBB05 TaxID=2604139 RepID=UPI001D2CF71B|nr:hypothetical protein [Pantanalinema sp. GBBB05]
MNGRNYGNQQADQVEPWSVRTDQETNFSQPIGGSDSGTEGFSGTVQSELERIPGGIREEEVSNITLLGGIVSQLIRQAEDKLANAEECLEWYEREKQRATSDLQHLKDLKARLEE